MTHETFKQILRLSENYTKEQVCKFLDGSFDDAILEQWFELWRQGKHRQIFDEIEQMNELRRNTQANDPERIPIDADKPRTPSNKNFESMMEQKNRRRTNHFNRIKGAKP